MKKLLNTPKLIKRIWLILWAILGILLILKFCFNIWYPITIKNEKLLNIFYYIDNNPIILRLIAYPLYVISSYLLFLTCICKKKFKYNTLLLLYVLFSLVIVIIKDIIPIIGLLFEISLVALSIIYNIKFKTYNKLIFNIIYPILVYILLNVWQLNIFLIRDFNLDLLQNLPSMYSIILMLDYYIFLIITYIGVCHMGIFSWGWLFKKELTELEAMKAEELKKENPDKELLSQIDKAIEQKKAE